MNVGLRPANSDDARLLLDWANEPQVRAASFSSDPIEWEGHERWFASKLRDPCCRFYIVELDGRPVGQVRFDLDDRAALVSISIAADQRERGLGTQALRLACEAIAADARVEEVVAQIKSENERSLRAFRAAGFGIVADISVGGTPAKLCRLTIAAAS